MPYVTEELRARFNEGTDIPAVLIEHRIKFVQLGQELVDRGLFYPAIIGVIEDLFFLYECEEGWENKLDIAERIVKTCTATSRLPRGALVKTYGELGQIIGMGMK